MDDGERSRSAEKSGDRLERRVSADPERAKAALWSALVAWERAVGGAHPDERVGADALRKVLAEQGYFQ